MKKVLIGAAIGFGAAALGYVGLIAYTAYALRDINLKDVFLESEVK